MEEQKTRIKTNAILIDSSLGDVGDLLDFIVDDVVNRALVYMNRFQFVLTEEELEETEEEDIVKVLPVALETSLSSVVVGVHKTITENAKETAMINNLKDGDQSITYSTEMTNYLSSTPDKDIFISIKGLLDKFRVPTIVEHS